MDYRILSVLFTCPFRYHFLWFNAWTVSSCKGIYRLSYVFVGIFFNEIFEQREKALYEYLQRVPPNLSVWCIINNFLTLRTHAVEGKRLTSQNRIRPCMLCKVDIRSQYFYRISVTFTFHSWKSKGFWLFEFFPIGSTLLSVRVDMDLRVSMADIRSIIVLHWSTSIPLHNANIIRKCAEKTMKTTDKTCDTGLNVGKPVLNPKNQACFFSYSD